MKKILLALVLMTFALTGNAHAGTIDSVVEADGDALWHTQIHVGNWWVTGDPRIDVSCWGGNYNPWEWTRCTGYMQYSLSELAGVVPADISSVYISLYIESIYIGDWGSGVGAGTLYHASNSSSATGNATQSIGGDQWVGLISEQPLGWVSFDVTDYIKSDLTNGYAYSAFSMSYTFGGEGASSVSFTSAEGGANASLLRFDIPPTYAYYASGRLQSITYAVPEDGTSYIEYLDEDWLGQGYGRVSKEVLAAPDADGALSYEYTYGLPTTLLTAKLGGAAGDDVIVAAGSDGLWEYMDNSSWTRITPAIAETVARGKLNANSVDEILADLGSSGLWLYTDNSAWTRLSASDAQNIVIGDFDNSGIDDVAVDFGSTGLWKYSNNSTWSMISASDPDDVVVGDIDNSGLADAIVDFGALGLYKFVDDTAWYKISDSNTEKITIADMDANGTNDMIVDFGSLGLYKYMNGAEWYLISDSNPESLVVADLDKNGTNDMVVDFGSVGLWKYSNNADWTKISDTNPEKMVVADLDNNGTKDIVVDFGSIGLWKFMNNTSWERISSTDPTDVTIADIDGNGADDIVVDFGASGLYQYMNNGSWEFISTLNADRTTLKKGYSDDLFTYLVFTETYDASGNLIGTVYEDRYDYYPSFLMERKTEAATGDIYEFMDEDYNTQGYGRMLLIYDSSEEVYKTYSWNNGAGQVTVELYSGAYEPAIHSAVFNDVQAGEKTETFVYDHSGEQVNLNTGTNGWVMREHTIYDGAGGPMANHYVYNAAGDLILSENGATGQVAEYFDSGLLKRSNDGAGTICEYMNEDFGEQGYGRTILVTHPVEGTYQTWLWNDGMGQVTVGLYSGTYEPSNFSPNWSDVQSGEKTETFVYDHNGEQSNLDPNFNGWVMREHTTYSGAGGPLWEHYVYNAEGLLTLSAKAGDDLTTTYTYVSGTNWYDIEENYTFYSEAWQSSYWYFPDGNNDLYQYCLEDGNARRYYNPGNGWHETGLLEIIWDSANGEVYHYVPDEFNTGGDGRCDWRLNAARTVLYTCDTWYDGTTVDQSRNQYAWDEGNSWWQYVSTQDYDESGNPVGESYQIPGMETDHPEISDPVKPEHELRTFEYYSDGNIKTYKNSFDGNVYTYEDNDFFGVTNFEGQDHGLGRLARIDYPNGDFYDLQYWDNDTMSVQTMEKRYTNGPIVTTGFKVYMNEPFYGMPNVAEDKNAYGYEAVGTLIPSDTGFKLLVGLYDAGYIADGPWWIKSLPYNVGINGVAVEMDANNNVIVATTEWNEEAGATGAMGLRLVLLANDAEYPEDEGNGTELATLWWNGIDEEAPLDLSINDVLVTNSGNIFVVGNYGEYPNYQACLAIFTFDGGSTLTCEGSYLIGDIGDNTQGYELEINDDGNLVIHGTVQPLGVGDTQSYFWEYNGLGELENDGYDVMERAHDGWWFGGASTGRVYVDNEDNGSGEEISVTPAYVTGTGVPAIEYTSSGDMQADHGNMINFYYHQPDLSGETGFRGIFDDGLLVEGMPYLGPDDVRPTKAINLDGSVDWFLWGTTYFGEGYKDIAIECTPGGSWNAYTLSNIEGPSDLFNKVENWTPTSWDGTYSREYLPELGAWPQAGAYTTEYAPEIPDLYYNSGRLMVQGQSSGLINYLNEDWNGSGYGRVKSICRPGGEGSGPSYSLYGYFDSVTDRISYDYSFVYGSEDSLLDFEYKTFYNETYYSGPYNGDNISSMNGYGREYGYMNGAYTTDKNEKTYAYIYGTDKDLVSYQPKMSQILGGGTTYLYYNGAGGVYTTSPYAARVEFDDGSIGEFELIFNEGELTGQRMQKLTLSAGFADPTKAGHTFYFLWGSVTYPALGDPYTDVVIEQKDEDGLYYAYSGFHEDESNPDNLMNIGEWVPIDEGAAVDPDDFSQPLVERGDWWEWAEDNALMVEFPALSSTYNSDEFGRPIEKIDMNGAIDTKYAMTWDVGDETGLGNDTDYMTLDIWYDYDRDGNWDQYVYTGTYQNNGGYNMANFASWGAPLDYEFGYVGGIVLSLRTDAAELTSKDEGIVPGEDIAGFMTSVDALQAGSTGEGVPVALLDIWGTGAEGHGDDTYKVLAATAAGADIAKIDVSNQAGMITTSAVADAIRSAADMGAKVLVMPFGLQLVSGSIIDSIEYAAGKGAMLIAAAGNDAKEILDKSLAAQDKVITVGSVDNDGKISAWSNIGSEVDLYAPWDVMGNEKGTSFSAAFVGGITALILGENPALTADEVLAQLKVLLAPVQPKAEVKTKVDTELASKQAALVKQTEELSGTSPKVDGMVDPITQ